MTDHRPSMVGHVHLRVRALETALPFYREAIGLDVTERQGRFAFLTFGDRHHDVALQEVGADAPGPGSGVGLYHAAFEVDSPAALRAIAERLEDRGVETNAVDHGISKALYCDDPDGNGVEVYLDTRAENDQYEWWGQNEPFDPASLG